MNHPDSIPDTVSPTEAYVRFRIIAAALWPEEPIDLERYRRLVEFHQSEWDLNDDRTVHEIVQLVWCISSNATGMIP